MPDNIDAGRFFGIPTPLACWALSPSEGRKIAIISGLLAAATVVLIWYAHWVLAILVVIPVLVLSAAENQTFLLFMIFLIPLGWSLKSEGLLHDIPGAIRLLTIIGFFFGRALRRKLDFRQLLYPSISRISLCFLGVAAASIVLSSAGWTYSSAHALYRLSSYIGFFLVVSIWADSEERITKILRVLLYSTIMAASFALLQEAVGGYTSFWLYLNPPDDNFTEWSQRATSFLNYSNSLAGYLNLVIPLSLGLSIVGRGRWKTLGIFSCSLSIVALFATQSVGGVAAFVAILILGTLRLEKRNKRRFLGVTLIALLVCVAYLSRTVLNPAHGGESVGSETLTRLVLWNTAWNFFTHSPVLGVGWGNFVNLYGLYIQSMLAWIPSGVFAVHNIYLQLLAETGLAGFIVFIWLCFHSWRRSTYCMRTSSNSIRIAVAFGVQGAILSVLVHGCVDFLLQVSPQFGVLFWLLLGLLVACTRGNRGADCSPGASVVA